MPSCPRYWLNSFPATMKNTTYTALVSRMGTGVLLAQMPARTSHERDDARRHWGDKEPRVPLKLGEERLKEAKRHP